MDKLKIGYLLKHYCFLLIKNIIKIIVELMKH